MYMIFVIWVYYAVVSSSPEIVLMLVILFWEHWYLPENTGTWYLKNLGIYLSLIIYKMFYIDTLVINMKWKGFIKKKKTKLTSF